MGNYQFSIVAEIASRVGRLGLGRFVVVGQVA